MRARASRIAQRRGREIQRTVEAGVRATRDGARDIGRERTVLEKEDTAGRTASRRAERDGGLSAQRDRAIGVTSAERVVEGDTVAAEVGVAADGQTPALEHVGPAAQRQTRPAADRNASAINPL